MQAKHSRNSYYLNNLSALSRLRQMLFQALQRLAEAGRGAGETEPQVALAAGAEGGAGGQPDDDSWKEFLEDLDPEAFGKYKM